MEKDKIEIKGTTAMELFHLHGKVERMARELEFLTWQRDYWCQRYRLTVVEQTEAEANYDENKGF